MAGRLKDKVAIVAGAGSRGPGLGNGKATAILFAREGARVLCVDAELARAEETANLIHAEGNTALAFAADVARAVDCRAMVGEALARWGGLDILHNNVGVESRLDLMETTEEEWDRVMAIDLKTMLLTTQAAVPAMEQRGGGAITCISSIAGMVGHGRTAYAAAKAGVIGFVTSVAVQLGPKRIRVNARNAERNRDEVVRLVDETYWERFVASCDVLEGFWDNDTMGYFLFAARKP